ncbi:hypothetical protein PGQ11_006382 [Apiospora arundinis]|uniref:SMODS and SLOG-associating 2TM effector domain-containing protein n=1 Tax=Apiospora arundinis TaxID=335852 RepID=A0ABR2IT84_9PEZI
MATTIYPSSQPPILSGIKMDEQKSDAPPPPPSSHNPEHSRPRTPDFTAHDELRLLSHEEWVQFCRGVGCFRDEESETLVRPTCWYWPAKGLPDGLYRDVMWEKAKFTYWFHMLSTIRWILMCLQLALSACLTALGSFSHEDGKPITIIAAISTCTAGVLALMHNSGLPDRYRSDRNEFYQVEVYIKEIMDTKLAAADQNIMEVMASCFDKFREARQTVQNNIPASYTPAAITSPTALRGSQKLKPGQKIR